MMGLLKTHKPRWALIAGALLTIAAIGTAMEATEDGQMQRLDDQVVPDPQVLSRVDAPAQTDLVISDIQLTSSTGASMDDLQTCEMSFSAKPGPAAMIHVMIDAPCKPNERVVLHHDGMMFAISTDAEGARQVMVPALSEEAIVMAAFGDGSAAMAAVNMPLVNYYDRVVLQWPGDAGLHMHAFEDGAARSELGHVWSGQPSDVAYATFGKGGFLSSLGQPNIENPLFAQVYTYPSGMAETIVPVDMLVETKVTAANCGETVWLQTLRRLPEQDLIIEDVSVTLPPCGDVGQFRKLDNLLKPLRAAQ